MTQRMLPGGLLLALGTAVTLTAFGPAAEPGGDKPITPPKYYGAGQCAKCHREAFGIDRDGELPSIDFVRLDEWSIHTQHDKHSRAYDYMLKEYEWKEVAGPDGKQVWKEFEKPGPSRGVRMSRLLAQAHGYKGDPDTYITRREAGCLGCHATAASMPATDVAKNSFSITHGVSCEACHGPSRDWFAEHVVDTWRLQSPAYKEAKGLVDLRDPVKKAANCVSCHVGNAREGKVLTHEMYAVGHPPLPSFELATFCDLMPRHWKLKKEVPYFNDRDKYKERLPSDTDLLKRFHYRRGDRERARDLATGALLTFRETVQLLVDQARECTSDRPGAPRTIDLANFDCLACHHDLKGNSWRQLRGFKGAPGRPVLPTWPETLVRLSLRLATPLADNNQALAAQVKAWEGKVKALHDAITAQPLGDPKKVIAAGDALIQEANSRLQAIATSPQVLDAAVVAALLKELRDQVPPKIEKDKAAGLVDYETARQLAWAFKVLHDESADRPAQLHGWDELDRELYLTPSQRDSISARLPLALRQLNDFDPSRFHQRFVRLIATD